LKRIGVVHSCERIISPGSETEARLIRGIEFLKNNQVDILILSGGVFQDKTTGKLLLGKTAAEFMKDWIEKNCPKIPKKKILMESKSVDTISNVQESYKIIQGLLKENEPIEIYVISSFYHVPRIWYIWHRLIKELNLKNFSVLLAPVYIPLSLIGLIKRIIVEFVGLYATWKDPTGKNHIIHRLIRRKRKTKQRFV